MKELYRIIDTLDMEKNQELVTVTEGEHASLQFLLTDGAVSWCSEPGMEEVLDKTKPQFLFREKLSRTIRLVVCGCGFVGQSVIHMAKLLGWHVTALDDREEYTLRAAEAGADEVICGPFSQTLCQVPFGSSTCCVIVTREHRCDRECLGVILAKPFGYLGMMGSHTRAQKMRDSLREEGFEENTIDSIHAPVGLSIGAQTPGEIAVSIIAQIISEKAGFLAGSTFSDEMLKALKELSHSTSHAVMALIISREGSTPRRPGARMLVYPDGKTAGTIGGGLMEAAVIREAVLALKDPSSFHPCTMTIDLTGRKGAYTDMVCGGMTQVFLELL